MAFNTLASGLLWGCSHQNNQIARAFACA